MINELELDKDKKYRIRQWDDMEKEYGLNDEGDIKVPGVFVQEMKHLCGRLITQVDLSCGDVGDWEITEEMLEDGEKEIKIEIHNNKTNLLPFMDAFRMAVENDKRIKHKDMFSPVEWLELFWDYSKDEIIEMSKSDEWEVF